jgi:hypothetical protein
MDFEELDIYYDPMELRTRAAFDVHFGLMSPARFYMKFNPDVKTEKEALEKIRENLMQYEELKAEGFDISEIDWAMRYGKKG